MKKSKILNIVFVKDRNVENRLIGAVIFKEGANSKFITVEEAHNECLQLLKEKKHSKAVSNYFKTGECNVKYIYKLYYEELLKYEKDFEKSSKNPLEKKESVETGYDSDNKRKKITALIVAAIMALTMPGAVKNAIQKMNEKNNDEPTTSTTQGSESDVIFDYEDETTENKEVTEKEETTTKRKEETTTKRKEETTTKRKEETTSKRKEETTTKRKEETTSKTTEDYNDINIGDRYEYEEPWTDNSDAQYIYSNDPEEVRKSKIADVIVEFMSKQPEASSEKPKILTK